MTLPLFPVGHVEQPVDTSRDAWRTPRVLGRNLVDEFGCKLDLCADASNALCERFYTAADDALSRAWDAIAWCNPPYSDPAPFVDRAIEEAHAGRFRIVMLLPASVGVSWFTRITLACEWWTFNERIAFEPPPGIKPSSNNAGSILAVVGYGYQSMWRGVRCAVTGAVLVDNASKPQRQRSRRTK